MFVEYFVHIIWETNEHMAWGRGMVHRHTAYYSDINQMTILYILGNLISVINCITRGRYSIYLKSDLKISGRLPPL